MKEKAKIYFRDLGYGFVQCILNFMYLEVLLILYVLLYIGAYIISAFWYPISVFVLKKEFKFLTEYLSYGKGKGEDNKD